MTIFREESVGGILYDDSTMTYRYVEGGASNSARIIHPASSLRNTDFLRAPVRVYLELTRRCNLACRHCFAECGPSVDEGMPTETMLRLLDSLKDSGVINVRFTGGEPTARRDWHTILKYAKSLGMVVSLSSNGVFPDFEETVEKIADLALDQLTFSLDGLEEVNDNLRGKGTFKSVLAAAESLRGKAGQLRLTTVLTKLNNDQIPEMVDLAARYVDVINFVYMRFVGRAKNLLDQSLDFTGLQRSALAVRELQEKYSNLKIMHSGIPFMGYSASTSSPLEDFALSGLFIAADGAIWPQHYSAYQTDELKLGKFPDNSIDEIWSSSEKAHHFRSWLRRLAKRCEECDEFGVACAGISFEMEISRLIGDAPINPFCLSSTF